MKSQLIKNKKGQGAVNFVIPAAAVILLIWIAIFGGGPILASWLTGIPLWIIGLGILLIFLILKKK